MNPDRWVVAIGVVGAVVIVGGTVWYSLESPAPIPPAAVAVTTVPTTTPAAAPTEAARPVAAGAPSPESPGTEPTVSPLATPEPTPTATPVPVAARPAPAPKPASVATPKPSPPPPAGISHLTPPTLSRRPRVLVDVHGGWFRADHRPLILRKGQPVGSPKVARQKLVSSEVIQLLLTMDDKTDTGEYSLLLVGQDGVRSNAVIFEITK